MPALSLVVWGFAVALTCALTCSPALADPDASGLRDELFRQTLKHPQDVSLAFAYANACTELHDDEGAIGALERVLFYEPNDARLKAQLGFLYAQLHSSQMAKQYFEAALASPDLDAATRSKITALAPTTETGVTGNRAFAFIQTGVRYQTNAAFNPDSNTLRLLNQDFVFLHPQDRKADTNGFETLQLGYDYDLGNQRGDTIETRLTGYATQQVHLTDLNVGFYDISIGPRLALAPDALPGWTVKPYAVGGQVFLGGSRYLNSGGAGIVADLPVRPGYVIEPGAEIRRVDFNNASVFSSLNTGDTATISLAGQAAFSDMLSASARVYFTRDYADAAYQSSSSLAEEFALAVRFPALFRSIPSPWSMSPYVKLQQIQFDAPNPFIDDVTTRHDNEVQVGLVFDTPLSPNFGLVTNLQFAKVTSNIPNYRVNNFSVLTGPTVRF